jgi:hypothetical protein
LSLLAASRRRPTADNMRLRLRRHNWLDALMELASL